MNAFIDKDIDKWASYYSPEATFFYSSMPYYKPINLKQNKEGKIIREFIYGDSKHLQDW